MRNCDGCPMGRLCGTDDTFRRGRPFILFYSRDGTLIRCSLLEDEAVRAGILERYYHRPLPAKVMMKPSDTAI
jgi:hypothetical protein